MIGNEDILDYAGRIQHFTCKQMLNYFSESGNSFSSNTITSVLRRSVRKGILVKEGRGIFCLSQMGKLLFRPYFDEDMSLVEKTIRTQFPFINFCVWNSYDVKRFSHYVSNLNVVFVDVERECENSVFYALINQWPDKRIFLKPTLDDYNKYIYGKSTIVVRTLISEAPLVSLGDKRAMVTLEKVLVDSVVDADFYPFQGYESIRLFKNAYEVCSINEQKLLRYARRRNKETVIRNILSQLDENKIIRK